MSTAAAPELARDEFGSVVETPELVAASLAKLRLLREAHPIEHGGVVIPYWPDETDIFLLAFLRVAKFDQRKALARLQNFSVYMWDCVAEVGPLTAESCAGAYDLGFLRILDGGRDAMGRTVGFFRLRGFNLDRPPTEYLRLMLYVFLRLIRDERVQRRGVVFVEDLGGSTMSLTMRMYTRLSSDMRRKLMSGYAGVLPVRMHAVLYVNSPWYMALLFRVVRPFLSRKMVRRIHLMSSLSDVQHWIPPESLPVEYGGNLGEPGDAWMQRMLAAEADGSLPPALPAMFDPAHLPDRAAVAKAARHAVKASSVGVSDQELKAALGVRRVHAAASASGTSPPASAAGGAAACEEASAGEPTRV